MLFKDAITNFFANFQCTQVGDFDARPAATLSISSEIEVMYRICIYSEISLKPRELLFNLF